MGQNYLDLNLKKAKILALKEKKKVAGRISK